MTCLSTDTQPFMCSDRWYESCTRETVTIGPLEDYYWCPKESSLSSGRLFTAGPRGECSSFMFPENNGCEDHYDAVRESSDSFINHDPTLVLVFCRCKTTASEPQPLPKTLLELGLGVSARELTWSTF